MGRRQDAFTDLLEFASKLPWKASVCLAIIAYVGLHIVALSFANMPPVTNMAQLGGVVIRQSIHQFASFSQYIIPAGLLIGAIASFIKRSRSISLFNDVRTGPSSRVVALSWQEFEVLVAEGFRHRGFRVSERGGSRPDGGIDLVLTRAAERFLVQCKQWRAQRVGVTVIRELYGVMAAEGATGGYVVTSGSFTNEAHEFASGRNIELVDGDRLDGLLRDGRSVAPNSNAVKVRRTTSQVDAPMCPACDTPMIKRIAKQGRSAGEPFWGCRQFPKCRSTMPMT